MFEAVGPPIVLNEEQEREHVTQIRAILTPAPMNHWAMPGTLVRHVTSLLAGLKALPGASERRTRLEKAWKGFTDLSSTK
jgi:hypothetical protein